MFVQALAEYADACLDLTDESWEEKPVPYLIELGRDGAFLGITQRLTSVMLGKKSQEVAQTLSVPRSPVNRNSGLHPLLAADDVKYVLGAGPWTKQGQEQNHQERHHAFVDLIQQAAHKTGDADLAACACFYQRPGEVMQAKEALAKSRANPIVALSVDGPLTLRPAVREYWRQHYRSAMGDRVEKAGEGECLISGRFGPIAPTHEKIKGLSNLGGQGAGVALMSFDKEAFRSYGWEQNANSPVAPDRAMAYVLALNDMLRHCSGHRRDIAGVAFVFWTKRPVEYDPMLTVDQPDAGQVDKLLAFDPLADPDPNLFYMAGVGANGGRLLIRYWVSETLAIVKANQRGWFEGLQIKNPFSGGLSLYPKLWQLQRAIDPEGEPTQARTIALVRRAIEGRAQPLGFDMLAAALTRLRSSSEKREDPARLGLIRLCLNDIISKGERAMTAELDEGQQHPAYLCGRLLAVYESLQYSSGGDVNQTVTDRYYSLASTYPALAFPKLESLGQKHLRKLRREKPGASVNMAKEIDQLHLAIEQAAGFSFPDGLDLKDQGRFALGYHHQRAHQFDQSRNRKNQTQDAKASVQEEIQQ